MWLDTIFTSVLDSTAVSAITLTSFLLCVGTALILGLVTSLSYTIKTKYTKSFVVTLATLPAVVTMIIMMVNGNLGAGVAVAGTFSLVRFRSIPGTAKEIGAIFLAMGTGLAVGMGYIGYAIIFTIILNGLGIIYTLSPVGEPKLTQRILSITIPEDLNYTDAFDDLFMSYASEYELLNVKTTNMGSLFKLTYDIDLENIGAEKEFIDALRCRNGNLEIAMAKKYLSTGEL